MKLIECAKSQKNKAGRKMKKRKDLKQFFANIRGWISLTTKIEYSSKIQINKSNIFRIAREFELIEPLLFVLL